MEEHVVDCDAAGDGVLDDSVDGVRVAEDVNAQGMFQTTISGIRRQYLLICAIA